MKRSILALLLLALAVVAVTGYLAGRHDEQYRTLIATGDRAVQAEDTFGGIEAFSGAIALRPSSMLAWLKRGDVYLRRGEPRSAVRDLRQAVTLDPAALQPLELLGDANSALERYDRAAQEYEAYVRLDDRDVRVLYKLALVRMYDGRFDAAEAVLIRALRVRDSADLRALLGLSYTRQQRTAEAITQFQRAVSLDPAMLETRQSLAELYRRAGRTSDELRELTAVAALDPDQQGPQIAIADAWLRSGRPDMAVTTLARAIQRFPEDAALLSALGRVWLTEAGTQNDRVALGKALVALRRSVSRTPSEAALTLLGRAQLAAGDLTGGLRSLQQAAATLPTDPRVFSDIANTAERLKRWSIARDALIQQAALSGDATPTRARADRAMRISTLSSRLGDKDAAASWMRRATEASAEQHAETHARATTGPAPLSKH